MRRIAFILSLFTSIPVFSQQIVSNNPLINEAFNLAVKTVDINVRRGILAAGADYGGDWTRDIAINSWNGVSLLRPQVAGRSLWSITINKDTIGLQYWDKIIWTIAAYNHYLVTGDKTFLRQAYICSANTMRQLEQQALDAKYGLFTGPSVFNDGIAAYPEPIYEPGNNFSGVLDHKNSIYIKCLSTNCVYYGAYLALYKMALTLNAGSSVTKAYEQKARDLKQNILKYFYDSNTNSFSYLVDQNGNTFKSQEGLGISFAVIFGIIEGDKANQLIGHAIVSKYGITSIYPDFPRYSKQKPGRHNNIIWPMVNGFFAKASVVSGNDTTFANELFNLTHLALDEDKGDYDFREIYNPYTGKPDGGWQANGDQYPEYHWASCKLQTWSATAYISMILNGVIGLRLNEQTLSFAPYLPQGINNIQLKDLPYRNAFLTISIKGSGGTITSFLLDGIPRKRIPSLRAYAGGIVSLLNLNNGERRAASSLPFVLSDTPFCNLVNFS
jgi:hypothetical protein